MIWSLGEVLFGLILLTWGADRFVSGAAAAAKKLGVTPLLIGLTILALGTSAPEILVSVLSALQGEPDLAIGNAIGSNIVNVGLVLGIVCILQPIKITSATIRTEMSTLLAVSLLVVTVFLDSYLSENESLILLGVLCLVIFWMIKTGLGSSETDSLAAEYDAEIPSYTSLNITVFWIAVGLGSLLYGADLLVDGAVSIARFIGISEVVIGIVLVAFGTSLPELAVSVASVLKREYGMVLGNIIGSNIFNSLAVIGIAGFITPLQVPPSVMSLHIPVMIGFTLGLFIMTYDSGKKCAIRRLGGVLFLTSFCTYEAYIIVSYIL